MIEVIMENMGNMIKTVVIIKNMEIKTIIMEIKTVFSGCNEKPLYRTVVNRGTKLKKKHKTNLFCFCFCALWL